MIVKVVLTPPPTPVIYFVLIYALIYSFSCGGGGVMSFSSPLIMRLFSCIFFVKAAFPFDGFTVVACRGAVFFLCMRTAKVLP